ncbi:uncharacterized protein TNIN_56931 [Trichonephila inaurata madagascariensis]|uniref:Uncharacterized protein n=1 Tax=Trichonephila inaurata madagascariensis TaxID=2747483 RepID=A0A8X7CSV8_9ARAC|nr:uncharacterized protein TNIN_56931 [Trichonephila inaurata madagascariensis]
MGKFLVNFWKNEKPSSVEKISDSQLSRIDKICEEIKKGDQNYSEKTVRTNGAPGECKRLIKEGVTPETLFAKLGESLKEQEEHYKYYIKDFLPALLGEIIQSKELKPEKIKEIVGIISDAIKQSGKEEYENFQRFLPALLQEIIKSRKLKPEKIKEIVGIISGITKRSSNKYSKIEKQPINSIKEEIPVSSTGMTENNVESPMTQDQTQQELESLTKEEVCVRDSDSGIGSPRTSEENLKSPVSSRRSSINSTLSSVEEDNGLQQEDEGETKLAHLTKTRAKGPSGRRSPSKHHEKKDPMQPEEKRDRENATTTVQKLPVNEKKGEDTPLKKQPNNRNLHVALIAGCALSTIGCIVAGVMTSGLIGAGLLAMAAVFAIAAVAELHSNFLSSKLTSISVEPHVNDKELTACSRL